MITFTAAVQLKLSRYFPLQLLLLDHTTDKFHITHKRQLTLIPHTIWRRKSWRFQLSSSLHRFMFVTCRMNDLQLLRENAFLKGLHRAGNLAGNQIQLLPGWVLVWVVLPSKLLFTYYIHLSTFSRAELMQRKKQLIGCAIA